MVFAANPSQANPLSTCTSKATSAGRFALQSARGNSSRSPSSTASQLWVLHITVQTCCLDHIFSDSDLEVYLAWISCLVQTGLGHQIVHQPQMHSTNSFSCSCLFPTFTEDLLQTRGGSHVNYLSDQLANLFIEHLGKKHKGIKLKPFQIKNHL